MPNDFFRFKQFNIRQDKGAMKVCTDACLFGAWAAGKVSGFQSPVSSCIDIGAGTGLLALMCAQKKPNAIIDAVEIDEAAAQQANENFEASPWKNRLNIHHTSIQQFANSKIFQSINSKYDLIISNPPFFENDLESNNEKRNLALHSAALSLEELIIAVNKLLKDDGSFFVLLPYHRTNYFEQVVTNKNLFIREKVFIKQTPRHNYFRSMLWLTKTSATTTQSEIIIMETDHTYSNEFTELLKDYYLHL